MRRQEAIKDGVAGLVPVPNLSGQLLRGDALWGAYFCFLIHAAVAASLKLACSFFNGLSGLARVSFVVFDQLSSTSDTRQAIKRCARQEAQVLFGTPSGLGVIKRREL